MSASRIVSRLSFSLKFFNGKPVSSLKSNTLPQLFASPNRISSISRLPVELSCLLSMLPLHSAIASCRLKSSLSADSQTWSLIPQGISLPL